MAAIPLILSLLGVLIGPPIARARQACPHRGKVWGAFLTPLLALAVPSLQFQALGASLAAAVGAGLTAHKAVKQTFGVVAALGATMMLLLKQNGF